jgi:type IV pilus assembly protein PilW
MRLRQAGMSLIEIMVAVLIGMIGILIITQVYITSDNFNRSTLGEGGAQTNGMIALFSIERDVRSAGYGIANTAALGCGNIHWHYNGAYSTNAGGALPDIRLAPVIITSTAGQPDQLTTIYSTGSRQVIPAQITALDKTTSRLTIEGSAAFEPAGDLILLIGGSGCTLAKVTTVESGTQTLVMAADPNTAPQNAAAWGSFTTNYGSGDAVLNLGSAAVVRTYSISNFASDERPALQVNDPLLAAGGTPAQDVVEGIVDLKALYGKDNGAGGGTAGDGVVDAWNNTLPATADEWAQVLALKVAVVARIGNYEKPTAAGVCTATEALPTWSQSAVAALALPEGIPSCYRYRVFETTIPLRNMIWRL